VLGNIKFDKLPTNLEVAVEEIELELLTSKLIFVLNNFTIVELV
jgi:hypothetical protein